MNERREIARNALSGPVASIRTPFLADGTIDFHGLDRYVDFCLDAGSGALILTHGDSLFSLLDHAEIAAVTRAVVTRAGKRAFVCAATGIWATSEALRFAELCREIGADCLMALPPDWGHSCTSEAFAEYYSRLASVLPVMIVTNVFRNRGDHFGIETIGHVCDTTPGVVAVKDDLCGDFGKMLSKRCFGDIAVLVGGQKRNHLNVIEEGADGFLSTYITFHPVVAHSYWQAVTESDPDAARRIIDTYEVPLFDHIMKLPGGFDAGFHGIYELKGMYGRWRRAPYRDLCESEMESLSAICRDLGILT